ncbi:DUF6924 domain-containing protein [Streptomyces violaceorubidus]|uniref:DUF6924 domain-containing protein n=1 Tax=Streptomyces violaceorubidus TaxID=284042 RepID=UPI00068C2D97|nr:hypothetical protein [Streptomyces violaceorubidus]
MTKLPKSEDTLLIRTDFSDEAAWQDLRVAVTTPTDDDADFLAVLHIVDDRAYEGLTTREIVALAPEEDELLIVADRRARGEPEMPLLAVHVSAQDAGDRDAPFGGTDELRVVARELWSVENNIAMANMDWEEFVEAADDDVFRGF